MNTIYQFIFRSWLQDGERVIKVMGWRRMLIQNKFGGRSIIEPHFWWFK